MADSEKVGIDWREKLAKVASENYKVLVVTRNGSAIVNPESVNYSLDDMLIIVFETQNDNNIVLCQNSLNTWCIKGKGKIKTKYMFTSSQANIFGSGSASITNDDGTFNFSNSKLNDKCNKYGNAYYIMSESDLLKAYNSFDYNTFPSSNLQGFLLLRQWFGLCNKEVFNPNFHNISDFKNFIFGLSTDIWSGAGQGSFYGKPFSYSYWSRPRGSAYGQFLTKFPKTIEEILSEKLKSNDYISKHQFQNSQARMEGIGGEDYNIDEYIADITDIDVIGGAEVAKNLIPQSNCLVYDDRDISTQYNNYYTDLNGFYSPNTTEFRWGWCNGINMLVLNSEDFETNISNADAFIANPTTYNPPDYAQITTIDDSGVPDTTTTEPDAPDPEDESKDKNDDKDPTTFPNVWDSTTSASMYEITHEQLNSFINYFWGNGITADSNILELLQGLYGNISEAVLGVTFVPINLNIPKSQKGVKIGRLETSFLWDYITDNVVSKTIGSIDIKPQSKRKTFFDYAPYTEIKLYLPYLGIVDLDTNSYMDTTLSVKLIVDVASGNASYALLSDGCLYDTFTFQLGVSIPFTLSNGSQIQASYMQNAISCALTVATTPINPVNGVKTIGTELSALTDVTVPSYNNKGSISGASTLGNCQNCILYIKRPIYNRPSNYGRMVGFPVNKTFKLSTLKGYTVCENAKIASFDSKPTDTEYNEIISLLEKGVIL